MTQVHGSQSEPTLNAENYSRGFLIDERLMGAVVRQEAGYLAFVLDYEEGEYLGYELYDELEPALGAINQVQRDWHFESTGCGGDSGKCNSGACKLAGVGLCAKSASKSCC